jgi:hypothetical protein
MFDQKSSSHERRAFLQAILEHEEENEVLQKAKFVSERLTVTPLFFKECPGPVLIKMNKFAPISYPKHRKPLKVIQMSVLKAVALKAWPVDTFLTSRKVPEHALLYCKCCLL